MCVEHMLTQNKRAVASWDNGETYMYLAPDGTRCPIGRLIPPARYSPTFERSTLFNGEPALRAAVAAGIGVEFLTEDDLLWLSSFQRIHDDYEPHLWHDALLQFAVSHGLTFNPH